MAKVRDWGPGRSAVQAPRRSRDETRVEPGGENATVSFYSLCEYARGESLQWRRPVSVDDAPLRNVVQTEREKHQHVFAFYS